MTRDADGSGVSSHSRPKELRWKSPKGDGGLCSSLVALHISTKSDVGKRDRLRRDSSGGPHRLIVWSRRPRFVGIFSAYAFSTVAELFLRRVSRAPLKVQHKRGAGRGRIGRARPRARARLASFHVLGRNLRRIVSHALEADGDTRRSARRPARGRVRGLGGGWRRGRVGGYPALAPAARACRGPRRTRSNSSRSRSSLKSPSSRKLTSSGLRPLRSQRVADSSVPTSASSLALVLRSMSTRRARGQVFRVVVRGPVGSISRQVRAGS